MRTLFPGATAPDFLLPDQEGNARSHAYCDVWRFRDGKMAELRAIVVLAR